MDVASRGSPFSCLRIVIGSERTPVTIQSLVGRPVQPVDGRSDPEETNGTGESGLNTGSSVRRG